MNEYYPYGYSMLRTNVKRSKKNKYRGPRKRSRKRSRRKSRRKYYHKGGVNNRIGNPVMIPKSYRASKLPDQKVIDKSAMRAALNETRASIEYRSKLDMFKAIQELYKEAEQDVKMAEFDLQRNKIERSRTDTIEDYSLGIM